MKSLQIRSSTSILRRLLEDPELPQKIQSMRPTELVQLIHQVGLEDAGGIVAFASVQQIEGIFDEDLWHPRNIGGDEAFDASRFGLWLEIILELGAPGAAQKIAEMDEDFLTMAISHLVWVAELDWLQEDCESDPRLEKAMESSLYHEVEGFVLFAKDHHSWDALITLLSELETHHYSLLNRILSACSNHLVQEANDEGGLYRILTAEEQLADDVAYEREKRRESLGFVTPAEARAFLKLSEGPLDIPDHVSPARFRTPKLKGSSASHSIKPENRKEKLPILSSSARKYVKVQNFLQKEPENFNLRSEELNYLANVLMSGWNWNGHTPRPAEALEKVLQICEIGLQDLGTASSFLEAFRVGWSRWKSKKP